MDILSQKSQHSFFFIIWFFGIMSKKAVQNLVDVAFTESCRKSFSRCLFPSMPTSVKTDADGHVKQPYVVPESLCRVVSNDAKSNPTQTVFSVAAILALFDECSTYSLIYKDRNRRSGVSVHLSTEIVENCGADKKTYVKCTSDKIGKALGFCTMELRTQDSNRLLARGKHVKYLPMGWFYNVLTSPVVLPYAVYWLTLLSDTEYLKTSWLGKILARLLGIRSMPKDYKMPDFEGLSGAFRELQLRRVTNSIDKTNANTPHETTKNEFVQLSHIDVDREVNSEGHSTLVYEVKVLPHLKNMMGFMHGGAVAASIEEACVQTKRKFALEDNAAVASVPLNCFVKSMDIRYLSPMKVR